MKALANLLRRCHECNCPLGNRDLFCPRCGAKQRREKVACKRRGSVCLQPTRRVG